MKKTILYGFLFLGMFTACEDVYTPDIDAVDNMLVVDARIVRGQSGGVITMHETRGFNEPANYAKPTGALVSIVSSDGTVTELDTVRQGSTSVSMNFELGIEYKLKIEYKGETYESAFEPVPAVPQIDTVYGIAKTEITRPDGGKDVNDFREVEGVQLYADITGAKESPYFRFTARRVLQYTYPVKVGELTETMYGWESFYPHENYNIAAPAEYSSSTDIIKNPLYFLPKKLIRKPEHSFAGWILILQQYAISKNAYSYYKDLNSQLDSEGRLFDAVYVQARNNLKCTSDPNKTILGNFEIASVNETRYFINFISKSDGYLVKKIPFPYWISSNGEQLMERPDFWETPSKTYPNE